ncbi:helix-turn-helix transcriptional regulator [Oceanobacillus sp. FSL W7-1281]|uniref:helix-turn-helix domain-containing protein n=1 Tax=Oceanobacillus sp. FSL W7-1281 TaxID=2921698 RepID=UPI0030D94029
MEIPAALTKMRKEAKLKQTCMAKLMGMTRSNIAKLETGRIQTKAEDLLKWCKITNNPEMLMILYAAVDVATPLTQMITGFIRLGGII